MSGKKNLVSLAATFFLVALLGTACASAAPAPTVLPANTGVGAAPADTMAPPGTPVGEATGVIPNTGSGAPAVTLSPNTSRGIILADGKGMTLYAFTKDSPGVSTCTGQCATLWPPFTVPAGTTPTAGTGVFVNSLGTIQRADGTTQVTINNMPVYYYSKDANPGDIAGQGVGNVWYELDAAGNLATGTMSNGAPPQTPTQAPAGAAGTGVIPLTGAADTVTLSRISMGGSALADGAGMTLYVYAKDSPGVSNCTGQCAANWPPLTIDAGESPVVAASGTSITLGTIQRADGTLQVTVNNMPVYRFVKDTKPGDTNGQGVLGLWSILDEAGNVIAPPTP